MRNTDVDAETVGELRVLWKKRKPFFMQMEVGAPYDGCFYEPNIFLVTPPGSQMQKDLMNDIPVRWGARYEHARKILRDAQIASSQVIARFDWKWGALRRDRLGLGPISIEDLVELFDLSVALEDAELTAAIEFEAACANEPEPMKQPQLYVWPLYASGQGAAMDCVHSIRELAQVCEEESVSELATRPTWPDGLQGSRFLCNGSSYGRITLIAVAPMGPLNDALPAGERYWMHALRVADEQWHVSLPWECGDCGTVLTYDEYEGRPEATGYSGDGGIGVHLHDVLCDVCIQAGACDHCRDRSGDPMNYYDPQIKEHGWNLCECCTEKLLDECNLAGDVELGDTVQLLWWKDPDQISLPGVEVPMKLLFVNGDDKPIDGLTFDAEAIVATVNDMSLADRLDPAYGHGIALSGTAVENMAYRNYGKE